MKKAILLMSFMLVFSGVLMAQEITPAESGTWIDITTFTGMMGLVTAIVTQIAKLVPAISDKKWAKVLVAMAVGVLSTMACWALQVSDYLTGLIWWQALIAGVAVGLSAAGFYDVIKAIWSIFKPKEEDTITYNGKQ